MNNSNDLIAYCGLDCSQCFGYTRKLLPDVVAIGGTCDAYQPAEEIYKNTRQCLEVLHSRTQQKNGKYVNMLS